MYRIELSPGEETVFRSIEELAVAIKRGVVTPRARIFHNASSKWLPVQFHPHYKAALSMELSPAALVAGPQSRPLSSLTLELPPEPEAEPELEIPVATQEPETARPKDPAGQAARKKKKTSSKRITGETRSRRQSKPRRQLRIALVGALLIGGAQWVLSAPLFSRVQTPVLGDLTRLIQDHTQAMKRVSEPNTAGMVPVLPSSASAAPPEVVRHAPEPRRRLTTPSFGGTSRVESAALPELEPAPVPPLPVASLPSPDSVAARIVDSAAHRTIQGILTTVSGGDTPPAAKAPPKR
jgi:hypothetical protein